MNARNAKGATALFVDGPTSTSVTRILLQNGADVLVRNNRGVTALHTALMWSRHDHSSDKGLSRLEAVRSLTEETLKFPEDQILLLLQHGAQVDAHGDYEYTALIQAAGGGLTEAVWLLLKYGANPEERDEEGQTALMHAAMADRRDIIRLLLDHGVDPNAKDLEGMTAFALALDADFMEAAEMLRTAGAGRC